MRINTIYWVDRMEEIDQFKGTRFKILRKGYNGYPPFNIYLDLVDKVDLEEFLYPEERRLPLFIGTQFGVYPKVSFPDGQKFAVLGKSLLSGHVAGLSIYRKTKDKDEKLYWIPNIA